jgi:nicotinate (nicotinamide) nucleotide adenylyltransferase
MPKRLVLFGGSFNPPGIHHRALAEELSRQFDEVVIVPCGGRDDKPSVLSVEPIHRAIMCDLAFAGLPRVRVDAFDVENEKYTRTFALDEMYAHEGEVWQAVGSDLLIGGGHGASEVHGWARGEEVWNNLRFAVVTREGYELAPEDLPPHHVIIRAPQDGSSTELRRLANARAPLDGLLPPAVVAHIQRYGLYHGLLPKSTTILTLDRPRLRLIIDEANPSAVALAERFVPFRSDDPNLIVVCGGDGTMLHAIQDHWRERLPFVGVNAGHRGYLMNDAAAIDDVPAFLSNLRVDLQPMLLVETTGLHGEGRHYYAFNDTWVERDSGQAAWLEVSVDGQVRLPRLVADGALLSTPAGSTSYARAMGATPLLHDVHGWLLVGNNVLEPLGWKSAIIPATAKLSLKARHADKRPIRAFVDGQPAGQVLAMDVRLSQVAAAEIAFAPGRDMAVKLMEGFFPPFFPSSLDNNDNL